MIRVLIADEHPIARQGLQAMFANTPDIDIVATAENVPEFTEQVRVHSPDVILLDLCVKRHRITEAVASARQNDPGLRFLIFTTFRGPDEIAMALKSKMDGYVLKTDPLEELTKAIRAVSRGGVWLSPALLREQQGKAASLSLTEREREVLTLIAAGNSNHEVADTLFISEGTVKFHVNNILTKLGAADRTEAVVIGFQRGLLRLDTSPQKPILRTG